VCAAPKKLEHIADRHGTLRPPNAKGCESRRRLVRIVPPIYGLWHCEVHTSCICNDKIACVNRVVGEVPLPTTAGIVTIREAIQALWPVRSLAPLSLEESLKTFKGTKNKIYKRAYDSLLVEPLMKRDARIKAFVKAERFNPTDKVNPDPRMIQARDPRYNLHLARYLRGIEHEVYKLTRNGLPVILKCKNPSERADIILEKWARFEDPVCFSIDASRWDKHVTPKILQIEHDFYRSFYPGDPELDILLKWQMDNNCVTSNGLKYNVHGGRMSGDPNTASGNVLLMVAMIFAAARVLAIKRFEVADDGDDALVMCERSDFARLSAHLTPIFLEFGQELKIENVAYDFRDIIFCQSKMTWNGDKYVFARNWKKVLSQSCCGTKHWNMPNMVRPMFGLLGDCENAQHAGIPILQAFATRLRYLSGGQRAQLIHLDSSYQYRVGSYKTSQVLDLAPKPITTRARFEFQITWGVDPSTQIAIEQAISIWDPQVQFRDVGPEITIEPWAQHLDPGIPTPTCL